LGDGYRKLNFYGRRVRIKIEGFRLDYLLDRCLKEDIRLRSVRMRGIMEMVCWISASDLDRLRRLAKSSYRITAIDERGVIAGLLAFFHRPVLAAGCLIAAAIVLFQSQVVEAVEIQGYRGIPEQVIRKCLADHGVCEGAWKPDIDWEDAEQSIYENFPEVTWAKLVYSGRLVILSLSETDHDILGLDVPPSPDAAAAPRRTCVSLVASCGGYVDLINPLQGQAMVEAGDYVEEGQVLISGRVPMEPTTYGPEDEKKTEYFVQAKGEVWARVPYHLTFSQERYLLGQGEERTEKTQEEARRRAEQQIRAWTKENLPESAEILNKSLKFSSFGNIIEVSVLLEVRRQIASPQEEFIGTENTDTRDN